MARVENGTRMLTDFFGTQILKIQNIFIKTYLAYMFEKEFSLTLFFSCELCETLVPLWLIYITFMLVRGGNGCFATRIFADFFTTQT